MCRCDPYRLRKRLYHENVRDKLKYCDAVCMGTAFKKDGVFNGRVDEERVRSFMEIVYDIRARL